MSVWLYSFRKLIGAVSICLILPFVLPYLILRGHWTLGRPDIRTRQLSQTGIRSPSGTFLFTLFSIQPCDQDITNQWYSGRFKPDWYPSLSFLSARPEKYLPATSIERSAISFCDSQDYVPLRPAKRYYKSNSNLFIWREATRMESWWDTRGGWVEKRWSARNLSGRCICPYHWTCPICSLSAASF